jgi:hypothetical protein
MHQMLPVISTVAASTEVYDITCSIVAIRQLVQIRGSEFRLGTQKNSEGPGPNYAQLEQEKERQ